MTHLVTGTDALLGQSLGTCTIQRLIGRGGMGAVYLAQQTRPRREVAVKVLIPGLLLDQQSRSGFLARFRREADAIASLDHIHILPIYEYGEQEQVAYLVMPYVTGGSLHQLLEQRGPLPLNEALPILEQAAAALDYAHARGIIHRDLKPGNILFHSDGRLLLADFGLARVLREETDQNGASALTSVGVVIGTPEYLSPEQAAGQTLDQRTDIYSLGIVLFQMLTGRVPFSGATAVATAIQHAFSEPPALSQFNPAIPPATEAVVMKALAKNPEQRYASAGQLAQALRAAVGSAPGQVPQTVQGQPGTVLTPMILMGDDTMPKAPVVPAHEAHTVADITRVTNGRSGFLNERQFSPPPVHPTAPVKQRAARPSWQAVIFGIILILLLTVGASFAYLYIALKGPSTANIARSTPSTSIGTVTPLANVDLPTPAIPVGKLLYGTSLPGDPCDPVHASWSSTANVTCDTSATELANMNLHQLAGMFLDTLPNGSSVPNDYILQVQARQASHSHGSFGVLFRNQTGSPNLEGFSFLLSANNYWSSHVYDDSARGDTRLYQHRTTVQLHGLVTIDLLVQGGTFMLYINGREQGNAFSSHYLDGTVGLAVDRGADVFFSNFALYDLANR